MKIQLPVEIIANVFSFLSIKESMALIDAVPNNLKQVLYNRIYLNKILLLAELSSYNPNDWEVVIDLDGLQAWFSDAYFMKVHLKYLYISFNGLDDGEDEYFQYGQQLKSLIDDHRPYFQSIDRIDVYLDAHVTNVKQVVTILHSISHNIFNIIIWNDDSGLLDFEIWGQFDSFENLSSLDLSMNCIDDEASPDALQTLKFPANLQELHLNNNNLSNITPQFIENLPKSLKKLHLKDNILQEWDCNLDCLPNLQYLDLADNELNDINLDNFNRANLTLNLYGNLLDIDKEIQLETKAANIGINVIL